MISFYRQSTGDPTDTRFVTLLMSSMLRQFPRETYQAAVDNNLVKVVVSNLNIARYKGVPQHIRLIHDLEKARAVVYGENGDSKHREMLKAAEQKPSRGWFGFFGGKDNKTTTRQLESPVAKDVSRSSEEDELFNASAGTSGELRDMRHVQAKPGAARRRKAGVQDVQWESHYNEPNELPPLPPPKDTKAPVDELLIESDFVPVALGVCDVFPEYFEVTRELVHLIRAAKHNVTPFDLFELRFLAVACKLVSRHGKDADFEAHGMGEALVDLTQYIFNDSECRPYLDLNCKATNNEIKLSIKTMQDFIVDRENRLKTGVPLRTRSEPVPVG
jgi:hypothetical protein